MQTGGLCSPCGGAAAAKGAQGRQALKACRLRAVLDVNEAGRQPDLPLAESEASEADDEEVPTSSIFTILAWRIRSSV